MQKFRFLIKEWEIEYGPVVEGGEKDVKESIVGFNILTISQADFQLKAKALFSGISFEGFIHFLGGILEPQKILFIIHR